MGMTLSFLSAVWSLVSSPPGPFFLTTFRRGVPLPPVTLAETEEKKKWYDVGRDWEDRGMSASVMLMAVLPGDSGVLTDAVCGL